MVLTLLTLVIKGEFNTSLNYPDSKMEVLSEEYGTLTFEWTPVGKRFFSKKNPLKNQYNANTKFVSI